MTLENSLYKINKLKPVSYKKDNEETEYILKKKTVKETYPELIKTKSGFLEDILDWGLPVNCNSFLLKTDIPLQKGDLLGVYINKQFVSCVILDINEYLFTINKTFDDIFIQGTFSDCIEYIDYASFIPILIRSNQIQQEIIEKQQSQINCIMDILNFNKNK